MKDKPINLWFGIEWSGANYLALNCKKSKRNGKHYSKEVFEVGPCHDSIKNISYVNRFNMKNRSVESWSCIFKPWKAKGREVRRVLLWYKKKLRGEVKCSHCGK